jgi:hypothetical protein
MDLDDLAQDFSPPEAKFTSTPKPKNNQTTKQKKPKTNEKKKVVHVKKRSSDDDDLFGRMGLQTVDDLLNLRHSDASGSDINTEADDEDDIGWFFYLEYILLEQKKPIFY